MAVFLNSGHSRLDAAYKPSNVLCLPRLHGDNAGLSSSPGKRHVSRRKIQQHHPPHRLSAVVYGILRPADRQHPASRPMDDRKLFNIRVHSSTALHYVHPLPQLLSSRVQEAGSKNGSRLHLPANCGKLYPYMLVSLRDGAGPAMLALVWSLAALGIALDVFSRRRIEILQLSIYLLMGWVAVQQYNNLRAALSPRV